MLGNEWWLVAVVLVLGASFIVYILVFYYFSEVLKI